MADAVREEIRVLEVGQKDSVVGSPSVGGGGLMLSSGQGGVGEGVGTGDCFSSDTGEDFCDLATAGTADELTECKCAATERESERTRCRSEEDREGLEFSVLKEVTREGRLV